MTIDELKDQLRDLRAEFSTAMSEIARQINSMQDDIELLTKHAHQHEMPPEGT